MHSFNKKDLIQLLPLLIYMVGYTLIFAYIDHHNFGNYIILHTRMDDLIPFCEQFVIPYLSWFLFVPVGVGITLLTDREEYKRLSLMLCFGMTIFLLISIVFPNAQVLRPRIMPRENAFVDMVRMIYTKDSPTGIFPSIHVYNTLVLMISVHSEVRMKRTSALHRLFVDTWGILIILSTMFIKQHSTIDVTAAIIMAAVFYPIVYQNIAATKIVGENVVTG